MSNDPGEVARADQAEALAEVMAERGHTNAMRQAQINLVMAQTGVLHAKSQVSLQTALRIKALGGLLSAISLVVVLLGLAEFVRQVHEIVRHW